jgi:hypothetical protein
MRADPLIVKCRIKGCVVSHGMNRSRLPILARRKVGVMDFCAVMFVVGVIGVGEGDNGPGDRETGQQRKTQLHSVMPVKLELGQQVCRGDAKECA